jgi:hypothetical protein
LGEVAQVEWIKENAEHEAAVDPWWCRPRKLNKNTDDRFG